MYAPKDDWRSRLKPSVAVGAKSNLAGQCFGMRLARELDPLYETQAPGWSLLFLSLLSLG